MLRPGTGLGADGQAGGAASPTTAAAAPLGSPAGLPSNAKAARAGKKTTVVRGGLLGCVKQRIFTDMLDSVPGDYNILICDNRGAEILSICVRMHDLMDHGVTLVEDLGLPRQPVLSSAAIYLIEPTEESVRRVMQDWSFKNMYREAHVFFTSPASDNLIQLMASESRLVEALKACKDLLLDFAVPETLLFSFEMQGDIQKLFPPDVALSGGRENILGQTARRLVSVFFTMGAGVPTVRYQGTSRLAQQVARLFSEQVSATTRSNPSAFRLSTAAPGGMAEPEEPPLLILVDRSFDAVEPLLHERTYQCLLNDLMPLANGIYEQSFEGRGGQEGTRSCPIDEQDPYWCQYRHRFFPVCLEEIPRKLQELIAANPALANGMSNIAAGGSGNKLADVGSAIRALPEFQERQAKLSVHIDICTKIMDQYKQQKLAEVCEVEQDMATGRRSFKEIYDSVHRLTADASLPLPVRARLLLLLCAATNTREFTEAKKLMLLQESGLTSEADRCNSLSMFISRMGQLPQEKADGGNDGGAGDKTNSPNNKTNTLGNLMRRSLRTQRTAKQENKSASPAGSPTRAANVTGDSFRNQAYLILNAAVNSTLSMSDFPLFTGVSGAGLANVGRGAGPGSSSSVQQRRTLRSGTYGNDALNRGGATSGPGGDANVMLDLGHEGQYALKSRQRVVLFVLGGATYGEARAGYEISQLTRTETMVGGTSLLTPSKFLNALSALR